MKFVRAFLATLIVIGICLLLTQSIWVPKLVNAILRYEGSPIIVQPNVMVSTSASTEILGWKTYHDTKYGFQIQYPSDLIFSTSTDAGNSVFWIGNIRAKTVENSIGKQDYAAIQIFPTECLYPNAWGGVTSTVVVNGIQMRKQEVYKGNLVYTFPINQIQGNKTSCSTIIIGYSLDPAYRLVNGANLDMIPNDLQDLLKDRNDTSSSSWQLSTYQKILSTFKVAN